MNGFLKHASLSLRWLCVPLTAAMARYAGRYSRHHPCHQPSVVTYTVIISSSTMYLRRCPGVPSDLEQMPHLLNFLQTTGQC